MKSKVRIALASVRFRNGDKNYNTKKALEVIKQAVKRGADLIALPEMQISGYDLTSRQFYHEMAEPIPGPTTRLFGKIARDSGIYIIGGMPESSDGKTYNSAFFIGPEGTVGTYRKFCVSGPGWGEEWNESRVWDQGDKIEPWRTKIGTIGILICYDLYFPEVARILALKGAELLVCISASWASKEQFHLFLRSTAIQNNVFIGYTNLVGIGGYRCERYFGGPILVNPKGNVVARARSGIETVLIGEVDYARGRKKTPGSYLLQELRRFGLARIYEGLFV